MAAAWIRLYNLFSCYPGFVSNDPWNDLVYHHFCIAKNVSIFQQPRPLYTILYIMPVLMFTQIQRP